MVVLCIRDLDSLLDLAWQRTFSLVCRSFGHSHCEKTKNSSPLKCIPKGLEPE